MKISLQTAVITGSSRGLGRVIAIKLAQEGVKRIAVHYHTRKDEAETTLAFIRDTGADGVLVQGDTSDAKRAAEIVEEAAPAAARQMNRGGRILALSYTRGGTTGGWQPWVGMGSAKAAVESCAGTSRWHSRAMALR